MLEKKIGIIYNCDVIESSDLAKKLQENEQIVNAQ